MGFNSREEKTQPPNFPEPRQNLAGSLESKGVNRHPPPEGLVPGWMYMVLA
jgi:hypothetical protein